MRKRLLAGTLFTTLALSATPTLAQHSVARQWNEALLETIGSDYADPTIHARNLFHTSIALYDAWAVYGDGPEQTYLLGQTVGGFTVPFAGVPRPDDVEAARRQVGAYSPFMRRMHYHAEKASRRHTLHHPRTVRYSNSRSALGCTPVERGPVGDDWQ